MFTATFLPSFGLWSGFTDDTLVVAATVGASRDLGPSILVRPDDSEFFPASQLFTSGRTLFELEEITAADVTVTWT
jgi:hypothetical protein